jgi:hypothetical protein
MIAVKRTDDGFRYEGIPGKSGRWLVGGVVFELDEPPLAMSLISARTVLRYEGTLLNAHGLYVFAGVDQRNRLTLVAADGFTLVGVDLANLRMVQQVGMERIAECARAAPTTCRPPSGSSPRSGVTSTPARGQGARPRPEGPRSATTRCGSWPSDRR